MRIAISFGVRPAGVGIVGVLDRRQQLLDVVIAAADIEHAAIGQLVVGDVGEEIALAAQVAPFVAVVGEIAEVLRAVVMRHVVGVRRIGREGRLVRFLAIAVFVPTPVDRRAAALGDERNVVLDVGLIGRGRPVARHQLSDVSAAERQRHGREGEVFVGVGRRPIFLRPRRLAIVRRGVEGGAPIGLGIVEDRNAGRLGRAGIGFAVDCPADRLVFGAGAMFDPLRFARLAREHGDGVRRRGRVFGGEDIVENRETVGVAP